MILTTGLFEGEHAEYALLRRPDYARLKMLHDRHGPEAKAFRKAMHAFDALPLTKRCFRCREPATWATAYRMLSDNLYFWCDACDGHRCGASPGRLSDVCTWSDVLDHIDATCDGDPLGMVELVGLLAVAKGLPRRLTGAAAVGGRRQGCESDRPARPFSIRSLCKGQAWFC